jgi:hypothetical protein
VLLDTSFFASIQPEEGRPPVFKLLFVPQEVRTNLQDGALDTSPRSLFVKRIPVLSPSSSRRTAMQPSSSGVAMEFSSNRTSIAIGTRRSEPKSQHDPMRTGTAEQADGA